MTSYSLTVNTDPKLISRFNEAGSRMALCLAFGVSESDGATTFNVITAAIPGGQDKLSGHVTFTWEEKYQIAATEQAFQNRVKLAATTTPQTIDFGQKYQLRSDWTGGDVSNSADAPDNGFLFAIPKDTAATGLLYKPVSAGGPMTLQPFYASANGPLGEGSETLIPITTARVWYQGVEEAPIMSDNWIGRVMTVVYPIGTETTDMTVSCNAMGVWNHGPLASL